MNTQKQIDLRSDTVTLPSPEMRAVMANAPVGDDVYGEDPTVNRLEELAAEMLGKEAALFVSSGTQSNLLALMSHCQRGDEYIVSQIAHTYKYEGGGAAVLGSIQPQPIEIEPDGSLDLKKVEAAIKPDDFHFAQARLLCLENTVWGKVLPMDYLSQVGEFVKVKHLKSHLDGARVFNAAIKLKVKATEISKFFDSVSVCLSKGLGAPVGSVLCASREQIKEARKWRKMLGGGMRQVGILAAAAIYALENNINRLAEDHQNAMSLARGLADIEEINVDPNLVQTNMAFMDIEESMADRLSEYLKQRGILVSAYSSTRLVTHLNINEQEIKTVIDEIKSFFAKGHSL